MPRTKEAPKLIYLCEICHEALIEVKWNRKGDILMCNNTLCQRFHQPQGWSEKLQDIRVI